MFPTSAENPCSDGVLRFPSAGEISDQRHSSFIGFRENSIVDGRPEFVSSAMDMLNGMDDFFFPSAAHMDALNSEFPFNLGNVCDDMSA